MNLLISIILGMLPEVLFYTYFWIIIKNIKEKKKTFFLLMCIIYFLLIMVRRYEFLYYFIFNLLTYIVLKKLYKEDTNFLDFFIFFIPYGYLLIINILCYTLIENYYIAFVTNRLLMLALFISKRKFFDIYENLKKLWNRKTNNSKWIKSISLRVITICLMSMFIIISRKICLYIANMKGG